MSGDLIAITSPGGEMKDRMRVDFPIDEVAALRLGEEVSITVKGIVCRLEGKEYSDLKDGCIGIQVSDKTLRKTGNSQAEGIKQLSSDDGEGDY